MAVKSDGKDGNAGLPAPNLDASRPLYTELPVSGGGRVGVGPDTGPSGAVPPTKEKE